jgi:hypothetical protein
MSWSPTHESRWVVCYAPYSYPDSIYNPKLIYHLIYGLIPRLCIEVRQPAVLRVARGRFRVHYGWEGLESGCYVSAL